MKLLGINQDYQPINQPTQSQEGKVLAASYRYAKNMISSEKLDSLMNEDGFEIAQFTLTDLQQGELPYTPIGIIPVNNGLVIFSTDNTDSEIGYYNELEDTYTTIINDSAFDFNTSFPIKGVFEYNFRNELIVAWTDRNNPPRVININNVSSPFDINELLLFPEAIAPVISCSILNNGGSLDSGSYYITSYYLDNDGSKTNYFDISNPISVTNTTSTLSTFEGQAGGTSTNSAIRIAVSNIDTRFNKIVFIAIAKINGIISQYKFNEFKISSSSLTVVFTGGELKEDVLIEDILIKTPFYNKVQAITNLNKKLILAGLERDDILDLQKYVNGIKINYNSTLISPLNLSQSSIVEGNETFRHGEVYAFYFVAELKNGIGEIGYHIPGRPIDIIDQIWNTNNYLENEYSKLLADIYSPDANFLLEDDNIEPYNGIGAGVRYYQTRDTSDNSNSISNMGVWENEDEVYPDNENWEIWEVIAGEGVKLNDGYKTQKVKHHKFPTIKHLKETLYTSDVEYGKTKLDRLSITVSNVQIPDIIKDKINSWKIVYAKRTLENSIIISQSTFQFQGRQEGTSIPMLASAGNWNTTNFPGQSGREIEISGRYIKINAFDVLFDSPSVSPNYIFNNLKLSTETIGNSETERTLPRSGYYTDDGDHLPLIFSNFTAAASIAIAATDLNSLRRVFNSQYIANNIKDGDIDNIRGETALVMEIDTNDTIGIDVADTNKVRTADLHEDTYLTDLCQYKKNLYISFKNQDLIDTGYKQIDIDQTSLSAIYGGDIHICSYSQITTARLDALEFITDQSRLFYGVKALKYYLCESINNINLRYESNSSNSKFYPKSLISTAREDLDTNQSFLRLYNPELPLVLNYNKDHTSVNDLLALTIFDEEDEYISEYPFRIVSSIIPNNENSNILWKNFKANDYYEFRKDKGNIINVQGINEDLLIHTTNALFRTRDLGRLETGTIAVTLGSGQLFEFEPTEIINDTLGTQHLFSCFYSAIGYFSVDAAKGDVYLYSQEPKLLNEGLKVFLRDNLNTLDNPFSTTGITAAYDQKHKRLILAIKNGDESYTISYSFIENAWISFHDYLPDYLVNTRAKIYSIKNNFLYKHNEGEKGTYYDSIVFPSLVDIVFNEGKTLGKILNSISWITEIFDENENQLPDETLNYITISNHNQCSGKTELIYNNNYKLITASNIRNVDNSWYFNEFRDKVTNSNLKFLKSIFENYDVDLTNINNSLPWYNKRRLYSKYFITRLEYSNSDNKTLYLHEINFNYSLSDR